VANIVLLQSKKVQAAVGITSVQRDKMNTFAEANKNKVKAFLDEERKKNVDPRTINPQGPPFSDYFQELRQQVYSVMSPAQIRRLREITLQSVGTPSLTDPVVAKAVGISEEQRGKISVDLGEFESAARELTQGVAKKALEPFKGLKPSSKEDEVKLRQQANKAIRAAEVKVTPQVKAMKTNLDAKILKVLTDKQRATWKQLLGPKFNSGQ
jgi:hypothetical protein